MRLVYDCCYHLQRGNSNIYVSFKHVYLVVILVLSDFYKEWITADNPAPAHLVRRSSKTQIIHDIHRNTGTHEKAHKRMPHIRHTQHVGPLRTARTYVLFGTLLPALREPLCFAPLDSGQTPGVSNTRGISWGWLKGLTGFRPEPLATFFPNRLLTVNPLRGASPRGGPYLGGSKNPGRTRCVYKGAPRILYPGGLPPKSNMGVQKRDTFKTRGGPPPANKKFFFFCPTSAFATQTGGPN